MSKQRVSRWVSCAVALALVAGLALPAAAAPRSEGSFWTQVTAWIASWWGSLTEDLGAPALPSDGIFEKEGSYADPHGLAAPAPAAPPGQGPVTGGSLVQ